MTEETKKPWYSEGLRFGCTGCGGCCTGSPGFVWLTEEDLSNLCKAMNLTKDEFVRFYTRSVGGRLALKEHPKNYDCIFLKNKKQCSVYMARPKQCKTFPFWPDYLKDPKSWAEAASRCEGINHSEAPLVLQEDIETQLHHQLEKN